MKHTASTLGSWDDNEFYAYCPCGWRTPTQYGRSGLREACEKHNAQDERQLILPLQKTGKGILYNPQTGRLDVGRVL